MSLLYRAMWHDEGATAQDYLPAARLALTRWAVGDLDSNDPLPDGEHQLGTQRHLSIETVSGPGLSGFEARRSDEHLRPDHRVEQWHTRVLVITNEHMAYTLVENGVTTDDLATWVTLGRPRVVDALIASSVKPKLGASQIALDPISVSAGQTPALVDYLRSDGRTLPVIAFTQPRQELDTGRWAELATQAATRIAGVCQVVVLDLGAALELQTQLGTLAVHPGGVRTYLPAPLNTPYDGVRHRYVAPRLVAELDTRLVDRLVYSMSVLSTRRTVMDELHLEHPQGLREAPDTPDLQERVNELEFSLLEASEGYGEALEEQTRMTERIRRLERVVREHGLEGTLWAGLEDEEPDQGLPTSVDTCTLAVLFAEEHLTDHLSVHPDAPIDLDQLDAAIEARPWANTLWQGLRALSSYGEAKKAGFAGGFWDWCANSGDVRAWPATKKKLAMRESETVSQNPKLAAHRILPVDPAVSPDGRILMEAHLKISEGGGRLAPRVYFHDDTGGPTGKIHVGFIGPHHHLPNTKA